MHGGRYYAGRLRRRLALRSAVSLSGRLVAGCRSHSLTPEPRLVISPARITTIPNGVRFAATPASTLRSELGLEDDDRS